MDLQELKQTWSVLNERLAASEVYNKRMLYEAIRDRNKAAYDLFHRKVFRDILTTIVAIVLMTILWKRTSQLHFAAYCIVMACFSLQLLLLSGRGFILSRLNAGCSVQEQLRYITRYHQWCVGECVIGFPIGLFGLFLGLYIEWSARVTGVSIFFVFLFLAIGLAYGWYEWNRHQATISEIRQNLAELKEFE